MCGKRPSVEGCLPRKCGKRPSVESCLPQKCGKRPSVEGCLPWSVKMDLWYVVAVFAFVAEF